MLIAVEGPGSAGRVKIAKQLNQTLVEQGLDSILLGIAEGPLNITSSLLDNEESLLVRLAHDHWVCRNTIAAALKEHQIVIVERFTRNTVAFYGGSKKLGIEFVSQMSNLFVTPHENPNYVLYVTADHATMRAAKSAVSLLTEQEHYDYENAMQWLYNRDVYKSKAVGRVKTDDSAMQDHLLDQVAKIKQMLI